MQIIQKMAAQGDVLFIKVDSLPKNVTLEKSGNEIIVAHSETGHHHVAEGKLLKLYREDPMTCYLSLEEPTEIVHKRPFDTHKTFALTPGIWKIRRQREHTPEGWRMVQD